MAITTGDNEKIFDNIFEIDLNPNKLTHEATMSNKENEVNRIDQINQDHRNRQGGAGVLSGLTDQSNARCNLGEHTSPNRSMGETEIGLDGEGNSKSGQRFGNDQQGSNFPQPMRHAPFEPRQGQAAYGRQFIPTSGFGSMGQSAVFGMTHATTGGWGRPDLNQPSLDQDKLIEATVHIETEFANYIMKTSTVDFAPAMIDNPSEVNSARNAALAYLRTLRDYVVSQTCANIATESQNPDPFFISQRVPELIPVVAAGFESKEMIPLAHYLERLPANYPAFTIGTEEAKLMGLFGSFFYVGISKHSSGPLEHFLVMPDPEHIPEMMKDAIVEARNANAGRPGMRGANRY